MQKGTQSEMTRLEWGVIVSLIVSASSIVFTAGIVWQKVQANEVRITTLEATNSTNTDRLARIETKLDLLVSERPGAKK